MRDVEAERGIAGRAVSINSMRAVLIDTAKLLGALGPPAAPEPQSEQIDRKANRDALAAVLANKSRRRARPARRAVSGFSIDLSSDNDPYGAAAADIERLAALYRLRPAEKRLLLEELCIVDAPT